MEPPRLLGIPVALFCLYTIIRALKTGEYTNRWGVVRRGDFSFYVGLGACALTGLGAIAHTLGLIHFKPGL